MLQLNECGYMARHTEGLIIDRPQGTGCYVLVYYRTPAAITTPAGPLPAQGCVALFAPGQPHAYHSTAAPYVNDWVHFTATGDDLAELEIPLNTPIPCADAQWVANCVQNLAALQYLGTPLKPQLAHAGLSSLVLRVALFARTSTAAPSHRYQQSVNALRHEIYANPGAGHTVAALAAQLKLSPSYFQAVYKSCTGYTIGADLIQSRLNRARYLLENSAYPVGEVGRMSGYDCEAHFLRQFKKFVGISPGRYREQSAGS